DLAQASVERRQSLDRLAVREIPDCAEQCCQRGSARYRGQHEEDHNVPSRARESVIDFRALLKLGSFFRPARRKCGAAVPASHRSRQNLPPAGGTWPVLLAPIRGWDFERVPVLGRRNARTAINCAAPILLPALCVE